MIEPTPDYKNLDLSGEALQAATRMETRAQEAASQEMFQQLIAPLLTSEVKKVLEFGCGTAALSRRIARAAAHAVVYASDKSEGMLMVARHLVDVENLTNIRLERWDAIDETAFPFPHEQFDLIISSVVIPDLDDSQALMLIEKLASRLAPRGILAFVEQDLTTDAVNFPNFDLFRRIVGKETRNLKRTLALGLRPLLRQAGLQVLPRRSFLWTDEAYGTYTRDLLERFGQAARDRGQITLEEEDEWKNTLDELVQAGDFYYGLVYHLVAGTRE
jgi:2-polyprenyl-3-methyl-5-hydroxy-6-metoxy-1,4-benzoquinol methylase